MTVSELTVQAKLSGVCMHESCGRKYYTTGECKLHHNKHWSADNPEYRVYINMKARCYRINHPEYNRYGERGIAVCDRWLNGENGITGYNCFLKDMGYRSNNKLSIDRIDNLGNYEPNNCRWTTSAVQSINKRPAITNPHGVIGINQNKSGNWWAHIKANGQRHWLGTYSTKEEAIAARKAGELKYHKPLLEGVSK